MNSILFKSDAPFFLPHDDPRLEHVRKVLKLSDGDEIFAGKIGKTVSVCKLRYADGGAIITPDRPAPFAPPLNATLAVSFARPQIAQRLLFEAACFGVKNLVFYSASKGESDYEKSSLYSSGDFEKWLVKGAEQACAADIPTFFTARSLADAIDILNSLPLSSNSQKLAPDVYEAVSDLPAALQNSTEPHKILLLGSERGFSNPDRDLLRNNNFTLVSLGKRVLRTDTAAIASLSILSCHSK